MFGKKGKQSRSYEFSIGSIPTHHLLSMAQEEGRMFTHHALGGLADPRSSERDHHDDEARYHAGRVTSMKAKPLAKKTASFQYERKQAPVRWDEV